MLRIYHNRELIYSKYDNTINMSISYALLRIRNISLQFLDLPHLVEPLLTLARTEIGRAFNLFHIENQNQNFYDCYLINYNFSTIDYTNRNSMHIFNLTFAKRYMDEELELPHGIYIPQKKPIFNWKKEGF